MPNIIIMESGRMYAVKEKNSAKDTLNKVKCHNVMDKTYEVTIDNIKEPDLFQKEKFNEKYEIIEDLGNLPSVMIYGGPNNIW